MDLRLSSDRIFHLDIERPPGAASQLAATYPADNATGACCNSAEDFLVLGRIF
jgi:hypothetical protein